MYSQTTHDIKVSVRPEPISDESDPTRSVFSFAYTIRIENLGGESVTLLERHWRIFSAGEPLAEVVGPGVVGKQPTLKSGESFQYSSSAVIQDPIGSMQGSYTFRTSGGKYLQVEIPCFDLCYPVLLH